MGRIIRSAVTDELDSIMVVLDAFVNNAAKNTREGSIRAGFTYDKAARQLTIYCQDTGCGIPRKPGNAPMNRTTK